MGWPGVRMLAQSSVSSMQIPVGIVQGEVERRTANQCRQPTHRFLASAMPLIEAFHPSRQNCFLKFVAQLDGMARCANAGPKLGQFDAKLFQYFVAFLVW